MKHILLSGVCGFSLLAAPGLAHAQTLDPDAIDAADLSDPGETGGPVEGGADENVIIVTAQGRQQQLADVPVAISAINAETLKKSGANDIRELNQIAPSLLVSSTGNEANGSARVRGIGTVGDNPGLESSVAVFVTACIARAVVPALMKYSRSNVWRCFAAPRGRFLVAMRRQASLTW